MRIVSIDENKKIEKRISITPEIAKKYVALGFEVILSKNYGDHLGFKDIDFEKLGVKLSDNHWFFSNTREFLSNTNRQRSLPGTSYIYITYAYNWNSKCRGGGEFFF